jgi:hypothetical protein
METDPACFYKLIMEIKPTYVIHSACPSIDPWSDADLTINTYVKATRLLA